MKKLIDNSCDIDKNGIQIYEKDEKKSQGIVTVKKVIQVIVSSYVF